MTTSHYPASEVAEVAAGLIGMHHLNLVDAPIAYVFIEPAPLSHGRIVLGRARKVGGLNAFLVALAAGDAEPLPPVVDGQEEDDEEGPDYSFFVMEIALEEWRRSTEAERAALVDHELCHFQVDDLGRLKIRGHDLEEFNAVVQRHGLWRDDVQRFAGTCSSAGDACAVTT